MRHQLGAKNLNTPRFSVTCRKMSDVAYDLVSNVFYLALFLDKRRLGISYTPDKMKILNVQMGFPFPLVIDLLLFFPSIQL